MVLHLVIRDAIDHHPSSSQTSALRDQSPAQNPDAPRAPIANPLFGVNAQGLPQNPPHGPHAHQHARFGRPVAPPGHAPSPFSGPGFGIQPPPGSQTPAQLVAQQQQLIQQYMNQMNQRSGMAPGQQPRGGMGFGVGGPEQAGNPQFSPGNNNRGSNSPHPHPHPHPEHPPQPYIREGIGPNGEFYRVMMNSALIGPNGQVHHMNMPNLQQANMPPGPGGPFSTNDVQNILRTADAGQATSIMTNAMHRSASGASLANLNLGNQRQPIQTPGVTVPRRPGSTVPLSRTATPDQTRTPSYGSASFPANPALRAATPIQPEVYILNSPQGPRALLINSPSEMYYTPAARALAHPMMPAFNPAWFQPQSRTGAEVVQPPAQPHGAAAAAPAQQQAPQQGNIRVNLFQEPAVPRAAQPAQHIVAREVDRLQNPAVFARHPANPEGGLAGALLAALWPHVWLLIRLAVFVWWFTSSETSWTRWLLIMFVATVVFLVNTGLFNRMAADWFNPIRQHLEGLLPLAGPAPNRNRGNEPAAANAGPGQEAHNNNDHAPPAGRQQGEPDPAQVAARLVEQHRERNANWLLNQIRRLERAGLLFLASIAPGVAERHIAHLEAEARAERDRQEAAERAERERREEQERAAAEPATNTATTGEEESSGVAAGGQANGSGSSGEQQQQAVAAA